MTAREFLAGHRHPRRRPLRPRVHDRAGAPRRLRDPFGRLLGPRRSARRHRSRARRRSATTATARSRRRSPPASSARRAALDHLIVHFAKRPLERLDPEVVEILRLSAYQLLHLYSRAGLGGRRRCGEPDAGKIGKRSASGLVNAVLRTVSRHRSALPLPARPADETDRDACARLLEHHAVASALARGALVRSPRLGAAEAWMQFNNQPAPLTLRANTLRVDGRRICRAVWRPQDVVTRAGRFAPDALIVEEGHPLRGPDADAGRFRGAGRSLATGGAACRRTSGTARRSTPARRLAARRRRSRRRPWRRDWSSPATCAIAGWRCCEQTVRATGAGNVRLVQADLLADLPFRHRFSTRRSSTRHARASARCGAIRTSAGGGAKPTCRARRAQQRMLRHAAAVVAPGGRLVYATCSSEPEENDQVVAALPVERHRTSPPWTLDTRTAPCRPRRSTSAGIFGPSPTGTDSKPSSAPSSSAPRRPVGPITALMALRTRVWSAGKLLLLVGALFATYVLFAAASMRLALRAREVQVPDFTNHTANEATAMASDLGLAIHVDDARRLDPKIAAGHVLAQDPAPAADGPRTAERPGVAQRRSARRDRSGAQRPDRAVRAVAARAGRSRHRDGVGDSLGRVSRRRDRRAGSGRRTPPARTSRCS